MPGVRRWTNCNVSGSWDEREYNASADLRNCLCLQAYQRSVESSNLQDKALQVIRLKVVVALTLDV